MQQFRLLIIDDDPSWLRLAVKYFTLQGYKIYSAESCEAGLKLFYSHKPDCVLLDYNLLDANADEFCRKVRSEEKLVHVPIVIISAEDRREMPAYTVCQADAFILKGETCDKARAVLEAVMRRVYWERGIMRLGDLKLEKKGFRVFRFGKPILALSPGQFLLFSLLMKQSPNFVPEAEIAMCLWNSDFPPEKEDSIRGLVQRLRKKLGSQLGRRIKNKSRLGWIYLQPRLRSKRSISCCPIRITSHP